jgi:cell division protein FtsN
MRKSELVALMILCPMIVFAVDKIEPLNVKTGTWSMTYTGGATGQMPLSDEDLAKLTPEQRARLEQMLKQQAAIASQPKTVKRCVTEEDLKKSAFADDSKECTRTVIASSSTRLDVREECTRGDDKRTTTYHLQAPTPESVTGDVAMEMTRSGRTMKINTSFSAKWLGAACEDAK